MIADDRGDRPGAFAAIAPQAAIDPSKDPFAEGSEANTPPELWALRPDGGPANGPGWQVRAVPNLYPAFASDLPESEVDPNPELFNSRPANGRHEVIISSPRSIGSLTDLSAEELAVLIGAWRKRLAAHSESACRHLFVNEGQAAGASLPHSHAQLVATDFVPRWVAAEREAFSSYAERTNGGKLLEAILLEEVRRRERVIAIDDDCVLLAPWASAVAYQMMIVPRDGRERFEADGPGCSPMLGRALHMLKERFGAAPPLNLWVRTQPSGADFWTWRIDILPRLAQPAGIELGLGLGVNPVAPERAASELRDS